MLILTNARTNAMFAVNPAVIATMEERTDEKYPNTKVALVKIDGTFTPVKEDIGTCLRMLAAATRSMTQQPVQRTQQSNARPTELSDEEIAQMATR